MRIQVKNENGITLLALTVTIVTILILTGATLRLSIGENGVLTKANSAKYEESVARLEDFLNQYFVEHYNEMTSKENRLLTLANFEESNAWFIEKEDKNGKTHFFIIPENLPERIRKNLIDGSSVDKTEEEYINGIDVYGITSSLQVYYCKDDIEETIGVPYNNID